MQAIRTILELAEIATNSWMDDWCRGLVRFQIGLRDISAQTAAIMDQDMIPRLLLLRLCLIRVIPSVSRHAMRVKGDNNPAVTI